MTKYLGYSFNDPDLYEIVAFGQFDDGRKFYRTLHITAEVLNNEETINNMASDIVLSTTPEQIDRAIYLRSNEQG